MTLAFMSPPSMFEILLLLLAILLLFGAKRLPDLARAIGRSLGEFRKGRAEGEKDTPPSKPDQGDEKSKPA